MCHQKKKHSDILTSLSRASVSSTNVSWVRMMLSFFDRLDESRDDFDYLDIEAAMQDAKLEAPKVVKTRQGYQVMVFSRKLKKHIPQGHPTEAKPQPRRMRRCLRMCNLMKRKKTHGSFKAFSLDSDIMMMPEERN